MTPTRIPVLASPVSPASHRSLSDDDDRACDRRRRSDAGAAGTPPARAATRPRSPRPAAPASDRGVPRQRQQQGGGGEEAVPEWVSFPPPLSSRPSPLITLEGVPAAADAAAVIAGLAAAGLEAARVDAGESDGKGGATWHARLPPLDDDTGDVFAVAASAAAAANAAGLAVAGQRVAADGSPRRVALFAANAPPDWLDPASVRAAWPDAGLVRAHAPGGGGGAHKGYAILEFASPAAAAAAKARLDAVEAAMRPPRGGGGGGAAPGDPPPPPGWRPVRLTRGEWCFPRSVAASHARVLYLAGLRPSMRDEGALARALGRYGALAGVHVPRARGGGAPPSSAPPPAKPYAFVEFATAAGADAALRGLAGGELNALAGVAASLANPAKAPDAPPGGGAGGREPREQPRERERAAARGGAPASGAAAAAEAAARVARLAPAGAVAMPHPYPAHLHSPPMTAREAALTEQLAAARAAAAQYASAAAVATDAARALAAAADADAARRAADAVAMQAYGGGGGMAATARRCPRSRRPPLLLPACRPRTRWPCSKRRRRPRRTTRTVGGVGGGEAAAATTTTPLSTPASSSRPPAPRRTVRCPGRGRARGRRRRGGTARSGRSGG